MTDNLGELKKSTILLAILSGIAFAWFIYSRFSFQQEPAATDQNAGIRRELKQTKEDTASLRRRIDELERRLPASPPTPRTRKPRRAEGK